jgi:hypothetical protein
MASIKMNVLMMEAVGTSETLVSFYEITQLNDPQKRLVQLPIISSTCVKIEKSDYTVVKYKAVFRF